MTTPALPSVLRMTQVDDHRYAVENHGAPGPHSVVFGGQLLAQMIMIAGTRSEDKHVKTINAIFARAGRVDAETQIEIETFHSGRAFASHLLTAWQGDRLCSRAQVLTTVDEPDVIAHHLPSPVVPRPTADDARQVGGLVFPGAEYVVAGGVDLVDPTLPARPAELDVWYRSTDTPTDREVAQAVFAWGTDGFLIGTAMLPHEGVGYAHAHVTLDTGVIDHTITFHRPFDLSDWVLMRHVSPSAGGGRSFGRCDAFDSSGTLVASYSQDNMIRPMPQRG